MLHTFDDDDNNKIHIFRLFFFRFLYRTELKSHTASHHITSDHTITAHYYYYHPAAFQNDLIAQLDFEE